MQQSEAPWTQRKLILETERLSIFPLSPREMNLYVQGNLVLENSLDLKPGNRQITPELSDALKHAILPAVGNAKPGDIEFVTLWTLIYRQESVMVGDLCFKGGPGPKKDIEIGYGTYPQYQGQGFMSEAIAAITDWALGRPGVCVVLAETKEENLPSQRILQKAGFILDRHERKMMFWKKEALP